MREEGPLAGVRVLDFTRVLSGPYASRILVELGAEVVKLEPPEGDNTRFIGPHRNSLSLYFAEQNCGKRNISLDLARAEAVDLVLRLARDVDVVMENFRPGVMDRMGLGYEVLAAANPRVIYGTLTGYGQTGPWQGRRAYAALVHAEAGLIDLLSVFGRTSSKEAIERLSHADLYAGMQLAVGVISALYQRERTGAGQRVDVDMAKALLHANEYAAHLLTVPPDEGPPPAGMTAEIVSYDTADGGSATILPPRSGDVVKALGAAMGRDDLTTDARFADRASYRANIGEFTAIVQKWLLGWDDLDALEAHLNAHDLGFGRIRSVYELGATAWAKERDAVAEVSDRAGGALRLPNSPWEFSDAEAHVRGEPAYRGEHNRAVLAEVGLTPEELDALEMAGVLSHRGPKERPS